MDGINKEANPVYAGSPLVFCRMGKRALFDSQFLSQSEYGIACNAVQPADLVDRYAVADSQFSEHVPGLDGVINCSAGTDAGRQKLSYTPEIKNIIRSDVQIRCDS